MYESTPTSMLKHAKRLRMITIPLAMLVGCHIAWVAFGKVMMPSPGDTDTSAEIEASAPDHTAKKTEKRVASKPRSGRGRKNNSKRTNKKPAIKESQAVAISKSEDSNQLAQEQPVKVQQEEEQPKTEERDSFADLQRQFGSDNYSYEEPAAESVADIESEVDTLDSDSVDTQTTNPIASQESTNDTPAATVEAKSSSQVALEPKQDADQNDVADKNETATPVGEILQASVKAVVKGTEKVARKVDIDTIPVATFRPPGKMPEIVTPANLNESKTEDFLQLRNDGPLKFAFLLGQDVIELQPGEVRILQIDDSKTVPHVRFHRGGEFGDVDLKLEKSSYVFAVKSRGWEINAVE